MTHRVRAVMAYVASRMISGTEAPLVFDHAEDRHRSMGGTVNDRCVNVYDYSERCQLTGSGSAGCFQLFHHKDRVHLSLAITGESFRGFDHATGMPFRGAVSGPLVSIYDEVHHRRFSYWCESPRCSRMVAEGFAGAAELTDSQAQTPGPGNPARQ